jgi:chromosome segregation ATPase
LGRADKVAEFVKRGEEKGWCEITLRSNDIERPLKVRRELKRSDGTSQYKLNGVPVGQDRVKTEIKKLGCQLDNLCQFLPQDRVVAFAQLKPTQLLTETQKAIGNGKLDEEHKDLIKSKNDIADLERDVSRRVLRVAHFIFPECWHPPRFPPFPTPRPRRRPH